jgi:hypothetical protein
MKKINIPNYAQKNAEKGLNGSGYGTDKGRRRARYLLDRDRMTERVAQDVQSFLNRFHGMAEEHGYTSNISGALNLWGGQQDRRFLKYLDRKLN